MTIDVATMSEIYGVMSCQQCELEDLSLWTSEVYTDGRTKFLGRDKQALLYISSIV